MNEQAVAYLFPAPREQFACGGAAGFGELELSVSVSRTDRHAWMFDSSEECRRVLRYLSPAVSAVVCKGANPVTPINLAAALCSDAPERDVYLLEDNPTELLAGKARAAGIRGILNRSQAQDLLGIEEGSQAPLGLAAGAQERERLDVVACKASTRPLPFVTPSIAPSTVSNTTPDTVANTILDTVANTAPSTFAYTAPTFNSSTDAVNIVPFPVSDVPDGSPVTAPTAPAPLSQGRVVGYFSGRGGVGKSAVSLMTALLAKERGLRVALVDLDLQFGDLSYLAGKEPASKIQRLAVEQLCGSSELPPLAKDSLTLVIAPSLPEQGEQLAPALPQLLEGLAAQHDLVVLNTGSFWTDVHAKAVQRCDHLVFLMDQRATSIEACKQAVDLCLRLQVPQARLHYALNGCGRHAALTTQDVSFALGGADVTGLADGGTLVDELLSLGCPLELLKSGNAFVASLAGLLDCLVDNIGASAVAVSEQRGTGASPKEKQRGGVFDLTSLRNFFGGAQRVAT